MGKLTGWAVLGWLLLAAVIALVAVGWNIYQNDPNTKFLRDMVASLASNNQELAVTVHQMSITTDKLVDQTTEYQKALIRQSEAQTRRDNVVSGVCVVLVIILAGLAIYVVVDNRRRAR